MKWFVYYSMGSCNDGSCDFGLEAFDSEERAMARVRNIQSRSDFSWNGVVKVIYGNITMEDIK